MLSAMGFIVDLEQVNAGWDATTRRVEAYLTIILNLWAF